MKSIKSLITETEFRKMSLKIKPTDDEVNSISEYEWMTEIYPRRIFHETLKLCQEIQDAREQEIFSKVRKLKERIKLYDVGHKDFFLSDLVKNLVIEVNEIFGEETQAVKDELI